MGVLFVRQWSRLQSENTVTVSNDWFEHDYYATLGIASDATTKDITKAYRVLAKKYHPDANSADGTAAEKFKEVTQAYEVLGEPEKRKEYDYVRSMMEQNFAGQASGIPGFGPHGAYTESTPGENADLSDMLSGLFSRMRKPSTQYRTQADQSPFNDRDPSQSPQKSPYDIEANAGITFYQALEGTVVTISYTIPNQSKPSEVKVKVPPGVNDGQRIKVTGRGMMSPRGKKGNLYVTVDVAEHPWFGRKGRTLMVTVPISYAESIVGTNVTVPTLEKPVTVKVPVNTKSGTKMRVKGRGPEIGDQKGDLLITFDVVGPTSISENEREIYKSLIANQSANPRAKFGLEK